MTEPASGATAWFPGQDISPWAELKHARALQHLTSLQARIQVWAAGSRVTTRKVIADDRLSVDVYVDVPHVLPLNEIALDLGDAVHNFRASLDAVVWELSHLGGSSPTNPRTISFPVCTTEAAWTQACQSQIAWVPDEARDRIRLLQPFTAPVGQVTTIELLHLADIRDKHRSQLRCAFKANSINFDGAVLEFVDENEIPDPPFDLEIHETGELADGMKLLTVRSTARLESVTMPISIGMQISIETDSGERELGSMITGLAGQNRMALDIIYYGVEGARQRGLLAEDGTPDPQPTG